MTTAYKQIRDRPILTGLQEVNNYGGQLTALALPDGRYYRHDPGSSLTPDGVTVLAATGKGAGRWLLDGLNGLNLGWFTTGDAVADDTAGIQLALDAANRLRCVVYDTSDAQRYKITSALTLKPDMSGLFLLGTIEASGSGYTAVSATGPLRYKSFRIQLDGGGNALNGLSASFILLSEIDTIRVHNFVGFGCKIGRMYDSVIKNLSVELCGSSTQYAFSIDDGGDTSNMSHFLRIQVEQSREKAIYVSPNTLGCVFHNIHSERARVSSPTDTWFLGGSTITYTNVRLHASSEAGYSPANARCRVYGAQITINELRAESVTPVVAESTSEGLAQVVFNQINVQGSFERAGNGEVLVRGGYINSLSGPTNRLYLSDTTLETLSVGAAPSEDFALVLTRCWVKNLTSSVTNSYLKAVDCEIAAGEFCQGTTRLIGGKFSFGTETAGYRRILCSRATLVGNLTTDSGYYEFLNGTRLVGSLTIGASRSVVFDSGSYVTGSVSNMGPPDSSTYAGGFSVGQRIYDPKLPRFWLCTDATGAGVWSAHTVGSGPDFDQFPNLLLETEFLTDATTTLTPTSGWVILRRVVATRTGTVTKLSCNVSTAGATLTAGATNNGMALYSSTGTRLCIADGSTAFTTTGDKTLTTDTPVNIVAGTVYYIAICTTGTTPARFQSAPVAAMVNFGITTAPFNYMRVTTTGAGLATTLTLTSGVTSYGGSARPWIGAFS